MAGRPHDDDKGVSSILCCWHSEFFTEVHRRTLDRSWQYAVFPADGRFVLQAPIVFWCHRLSDQQSVAVLSRLLVQRPGTPCQKMQHFLSLNTPFAASSKRGFSRSLFRTSSSDTDCILTFSIFETVLAFKVWAYNMIRYDMIWYDIGVRMGTPLSYCFRRH